MKKLIVALFALFLTTPAHATIYKTCWDNEVIPWAVACPTPPKGVRPTKYPTPAPPPIHWVSAPLGTTPFARATKTCSSLYRNKETDRVNIHFNGVTVGKIYRVPTFPQLKSTLPYPSGWGNQVAVNIDGQTGDSWTLLDYNDATGWWATVSTQCLEGVKLT